MLFRSRQYRDDQACNDAFNVVGCEERFAEDRTILGAEQREWLLQTLEESTATWHVLANQLPIAPIDFKKGGKEGFRMEQWDGYVVDQQAVLQVFAESVENPVVITGDFHSHWASELPADPTDTDSEVVGVEFVGTSISSSGNGKRMDTNGRHVIEENENVYYNNDRRGYVRCTVNPDQWVAEHKVLPYVTAPGASIRTDAQFEVEAGNPGLVTPPTTLRPQSVAVRNGKTSTVELTARWLDAGLSGGHCTLTLSDPSVATITDATGRETFGLSNVAISDDGGSVTVQFADVDEAVQSIDGGIDVPIASMEVRGLNPGTTDLTVTVGRLDDEDGNSLPAHTRTGVVAVGPPATGGSGSGRAPSDPDADGLYEDVNGNGRLDYDDVVTLFDEFESDSVQLNGSAYDFNRNGTLDYDDIVTLAKEIN